MNFLRKIFLRVLLATSAVCAAPSAHAGIPVIDVANLIAALEQCIADITSIANEYTQITNQYTQITNQYQQIRQYQEQLEALKGARNLGDVLNNPLLQNYVPRDAARIVTRIESGGYGGLEGSARALRDARLVYNCNEFRSGDRTQCEAELARPYQTLAWMKDAQEASRDRLKQITDLMRKVNTTNDPKAIAEMQARIGAESALLQHEQSVIQMATGMQQAEDQILISRKREAQLEQTVRKGKLEDFVR